LIFAGLRRLYPQAEAVKNGSWTADPAGLMLYRPSTLTVGTLGFGRIARRVATYFRPIAKNILFYDPFVSDPGQEHGYCKAIGNAADLFERCQVVTVHVPLTAGTTKMIDSNLLDRGKGLVLVNTSRAGIVDWEALESALEDGRVAFYGADVFWQEPADYDNPRTREFLKRSNVLVTPHMSWYSMESEREVRRKAAEEILRVLRGEAPLHPVSS
jgi:D-3-phosphoglycerate dehydrogenase